MPAEPSTLTPPTEGPGPLQGVRVLELGSLIAGPYAGALLAQFGAEVIKVEPPGAGDPLRKWRKLHKGTSLWWYSQSRNKRSLSLNLKDARARDIVRRLVADTDVLIENFRPGQMEAWGLGWEDLAAIRPQLVMLRISGYGQTGPYRERPGFAAVAEGMGGLRHVSGYPDRPPVRTGISLGDSLASLYGVIGALLALHHLKVNRGQGQVIDVALYEAVFGVMESLVPEYDLFGFVRERSGARLPGIAPSSTYPCADDAYVIVAGNGDGIFRRLMAAIGRAELADDPRFADNAGRAAHAEYLDDVITLWTQQRPIAVVLAELTAADVPCGKSYTAADIVADPQFLARGMLERHALPDGQMVTFPGIVPRLSATPGRTRWLGPALGADTDTILAALGLDARQCAELRAAGVIG